MAHDRSSIERAARRHVAELYGPESGYRAGVARFARVLPVDVHRNLTGILETHMFEVTYGLDFKGKPLCEYLGRDRVHGCQEALSLINQFVLSCGIERTYFGFWGENSSESELLPGPETLRGLGVLLPRPGLQLAVAPSEEDFADEGFDLLEANMADEFGDDPLPRLWAALLKAAHQILQHSGAFTDNESCEAASFDLANLILRQTQTPRPDSLGGARPTPAGDLGVVEAAAALVPPSRRDWVAMYNECEAFLPTYLQGGLFTPAGRVDGVSGLRVETSLRYAMIIEYLTALGADLAKARMPVARILC